MKNILTQIILFSFVILQTVTAQNTLSGKITNQTTQQPIKDVTIYIPELNKGAVSDSSGSYSLTNLPDASFSIQFTSVGFASQVKIVTIPGTTELNINLETSVAEIREILVTTNSLALEDNSPFSVSSISRKEMTKYASPSVMGNLSYQPGVDKISIGNGIGKPVIRGLSFNRILLYSQGTRIENQQWDDHHDLGLTDFGLDHVEIVRGPAALIYGANALGGALIFVDDKQAPGGTTIADANLDFCSNTIGLKGDFGMNTTAKNGFFYGIRVGGNSQTSYLQGEGEDEDKPEGEEEEFAFNSKFISAAGKINAGVSKKWGMSKLSYSYTRQLIGIIEDEALEATNGAEEEENEQRHRDVEAPYQDVASQIISSENTFYARNSRINFNLSYQMNDRKEFEPLPHKEKERAIGLDLTTITYDLKYSSDAAKKFGFMLGTQGAFLNNKNNGLESLVPDAEERDMGVYGLVRYDREKLNLLGGVRFDTRHIEVESYEPANEENETTYIMLPGNDTIAEPEFEFEEEYTPVSFSIGGTYHLLPQLAIKLNGATGFTAPNYAQLATFGKHEGTYRFEMGNTSLNVEQNIEGDLGVSWEGKHFSLNASGYINKITGYIYIANSGRQIIRVRNSGTDTLPVYDYRQNDATFAGGEFGLTLHPASIKWLKIGATYATVNATLDKGGNVPYIPSDKIICDLTLSAKRIGRFTDGHFSVVVSNYVQQKDVAQYELSSDGYTLIDLFVGSTFRLSKQMVSFNVYCTNLLNTGYFSQLSLVKNIGVHDMGRNIGVQFHIPIGICKN